jgi:hypothetical protein
MDGYQHHGQPARCSGAGLTGSRHFSVRIAEFLETTWPFSPRSVLVQDAAGLGIEIIHGPVQHLRNAGTFLGRIQFAGARADGPRRLPLLQFCLSLLSYNTLVFSLVKTVFPPINATGRRGPQCRHADHRGYGYASWCRAGDVFDPGGGVTLVRETRGTWRIYPGRSLLRCAGATLERDAVPSHQMEWASRLVQRYQMARSKPAH